MIVRVWTGVVATNRVADYTAYVQATGVAEYARSPGCRQALVLTRSLGDGRSEVVAWSAWDDEAALRAFTGPNVDAMVLYPEDEDFLLSEPTLTHYAAAGSPESFSRRSRRHEEREDPPMLTSRQVAEAFSGHRFREAYDALAADVRWTSVGEGETAGRQGVIDACEASLAELSAGTAEFLRFVVIAEDDAVAVDTVGRYTDAGGEVSVVSSCDVFAFSAGLLTAIRSYAVEIDPATVASSS